MSIKVLLVLSVVCFAIAGLVFLIVSLRGAPTGKGSKRPFPAVKKKTIGSKKMKAETVEAIARSKGKLKPEAARSVELLKAVGESDPKLIASKVKKWLSEEGGGKLP